MRPAALLGAPSAIGIRPYDTGEPRRLDLTPGTLRALGIRERLAAHELGDITAPPYRDVARPAGRPRNEQEVAGYSASLGRAVRSALEWGRFPVLLGGDCSVLLGALLGAGGDGRVGVVYLDAHADFAEPHVSRTGSVASMVLALAVGRGGTQLSRLAGPIPLAREEDVVVIGRRDDGDLPDYGQAALRASAMLDLPGAVLQDRGPAAVAAAALDRLTEAGVDRIWIHLDADFLNPAVMPAVDSPIPGGPDIDDALELIAPLVRHPRAAGLDLTIYDPTLDPAHVAGRRLVDLLARAVRDPIPTFTGELARILGGLP
jgi:arginase